MDYIVFFIGGLVLLFLFVKLLSWPLKILWKLLINGVLGAALLIIVNFIGGHFGLSIGINPWTAIIAGFFGIPGVIFLILFKMFF